MKKILVLCTGNSCRSQMAEGYLKHFAGNKAEVYSAGVERHGVNPRAIEIMKEDNIDISKHTSNNVNEYRDINFDYVITVCDNAKERCPYFPSRAKKFHHDFPDPAKATGNDTQVIHQLETSGIRLKNTVRNLFPQISKSNRFKSLSYSFAKIKDHPERGGPMWPLRFTYCLYKLEWGSIYRLSDRFSCHNTCPYCIRFWLFSWLSFFRRWH